jgi:ATP-dependent DNA helicase UvrD/PcrA
MDRSTEERTWSSTEYARAQHELLAAALHTPEITGDAIGNLLLSQWTLGQLPDGNIWTPPVAPHAFNGDEELRISYTGFSVWEKCPRQYYYGHVLRLQSDDHSPQLTLGSAIHDTIEWMNEQRRDGHIPNEARLIDCFRENWNSEGFEAPAQEKQNRERGEALLRRFYRWEVHQQREIISTEMSFEIPFGRHTLTGRIDCVARDEEGRIEIIDYKSGRKSGTTKNAAIPQLAIYRLAWEASHPEDNPRTSLYFLRSNDDRRLSYNSEFKFNTHSWALDLEPEQIDDVRERLASFANGVLNNAFVPVNEASVCRNCPYTSICEGAATDG